MAEIVQSTDTQTDWQTGTLDGVEATSGGDLVLANDYALSFDGVNDYVNLGAQQLTSQYTIELVFKNQDLTKSYTPILTKEAATDFVDLFAVEFIDDSLRFINEYANTEYAQVTATTVFIENQQYHVAISVTDTGASIFVDGLLDAEETDSNFNSGACENAENLWVGKQYLARTDRYYNGLVGEIRIWNVARTQQQIQDNMNDTLNGDESGLVAYYLMTAGSGTTLTDHAGTNDGTIYGATWVWANDGTEITTPITGTRTAPTLDLSTLGTASATSTITWSATDNSQTISIETALSTDGGTTWGTWQTATNGGSIPGITTGMDLSTAQLKCRQTLSTTDTTVTPHLHSLSVTVREQSLVLGVVTDINGDPAVRTVRAYRRASPGELLAETTSAADGSYTLDVGIADEVIRIVYDDSATAPVLNDLIDRVIPEIGA